MVSFSDTDWLGWLAIYAYPAIRILAMLVSAPIFNNVGMPRKIRLIAGLAIAMGVAPAIPSAAPIAPGSFLVAGAIATEMMIGVAIGFTIRMMFVAVDLAGDLIGMQMGLSFAMFFDPQSAGQTTVIAQFLGLFASLLFLVMNGHLLVIETVVRSYEWLPAGGVGFEGNAAKAIVRSAAAIFSTGLLIALPAITTLLITNIALGVLTRAAPQLNLFALGFPITLTVGIFTIAVCLPLLANTLSAFYERGFEAVGLFLKLASGQ
ncbi:flagellar biosynthetic protein FliR [Niveibacterium sp. 24ML]|uniref:flagellar biosynthetic protein FliR n=1 Tax=Niveibacterium sp. 24ML TaxID=2985512 RepID=UPI00226E171D|nr:flagellar biosynthetic protein FliR [Niveibacterium sp. 24ML]MCX9157947.1 flagellar biosynthetic protein FliR [Niveibacterium sp. 24ML]